jgi:hypothetical protein
MTVWRRFEYFFFLFLYFREVERVLGKKRFLDEWNFSKTNRQQSKSLRKKGISATVREILNCF